MKKSVLLLGIIIGLLVVTFPSQAQSKVTESEILGTWKLVIDIEDAMEEAEEELDDEDNGDAVDAEFDDTDIVIDENFDPFSLESTGIDAGILGDNIATGDD